MFLGPRRDPPRLFARMPAPAIGDAQRSFSSPGDPRPPRYAPRQRMTAGRDDVPVPAAQPHGPCRDVRGAIALGACIRCLLELHQSLAAYALIVGASSLSLVVYVLTGQISFCQYSFRRDRRVSPVGPSSGGPRPGGFWPRLVLGRHLPSIVSGWRSGSRHCGCRARPRDALRSRSRCFFDHFPAASERVIRSRGCGSSWTVAPLSFPRASRRRRLRPSIPVHPGRVPPRTVLAFWNLSSAKTGRVLRAIRTESRRRRAA